MKKIGTSFFRRESEIVARELLGKILVHRHDGSVLRARIVETEAYVGAHDLACHAAKGRTERTEVMFGTGGCAYVYFIYGMYDMLNIVTGPKNDPQAVLIRACEPLDGWKADLSGPGKLTKAMRITRKLNGCNLTGPLLYLMDDGARVEKIASSARIGVDYSGEWKDALLRFFNPTSKAVSAPRKRLRK